MIHFLSRQLHRHVLVTRPACIAAFLFVLSSVVAYAHPTAALIPLPDSALRLPSNTQVLGPRAATASLTLGIVLPTSHPEEQRRLLTALYNPQSPLFHHWLTTGEFEARFAPSSAATAAVHEFVSSAGLRVLPNSPSASLLLVTGTTQQVEAAFHTQITDYRLADGEVSFGNTSAVQIPAALQGTIVGVVGLNNLHHQISHAQPDRQPNQRPNLPPPYGAGPNGRGLTPSQIAGIYNTTPVYKTLHDTGQGTTLGLFELSGYTRNDISVYEKTFGLPAVPVIDKPVLGGPIAIGGSVTYGAIEVELDIELQIATAPGAKRILVYNAPNTELGAIAEYLQIAQDNQADAVSTSWGSCEFFSDSTSRQEELHAFTQSALQGQSLFAASGDSGAFDCGDSGAQAGLQGADALQVDDPAANPFITGVGGTSFRQQNGGAILFDPGHNSAPPYPGTTAERVWNRGCTVHLNNDKYCSVCG